MHRTTWLALPLELLLVVTTLAPGSFGAPTEENDVATHIRQGLGFEDGASWTMRGDGSSSSSANATTSTPDVSATTDNVATGSGTAFASSCQSALRSWKQASESYGSLHEFLTTETRPGSVYATYTYTDFTGGVKASRTTTLCDGYARVIGSASYEDINTSTLSASPYPLSTSAPGPFTTPMPCSIGPSDCFELWKSFVSSTSASMVFENHSVLEPPCQTDTRNATLPFETASCGNYGIVGSDVRLLYWPVRTAETASSDPYFCSSYNSPTITPSYLPGTKTGEGPNTYVTGDITITSPSVAISFHGLHRLDGCGPTLDHTIIPLPTSQLSSVRGARAAYGWYPFNLADLNWRCESPNGIFTLQDTNQTTNGAECYQDVAAQAYWGAAPQVDYARGVWESHYSSLTILNNYHPYVIPDQDVGKDMLHSIWGPNATWWIDGIWDPPLALTQASGETLPTFPGGSGGEDASPTTQPGDYGGLTTPAMPAHTTPPELVPTAMPDMELTKSTEASVIPDTKPSTAPALDLSQGELGPTLPVPGNTASTSAEPDNHPLNNNPSDSNQPSSNEQPSNASPYSASPSNNNEPNSDQPGSTQSSNNQPHNMSPNSNAPSHGQTPSNNGPNGAEPQSSTSRFVPEPQNPGQTATISAGTEASTSVAAESAAAPDTLASGTMNTAAISIAQGQQTPTTATPSADGPGNGGSTTEDSQDATSSQQASSSAVALDSDSSGAASCSQSFSSGLLLLLYSSTVLLVASL